MIVRRIKQPAIVFILHYEARKMPNAALERLAQVTANRRIVMASPLQAHVRHRACRLLQVDRQTGNLHFALFFNYVEVEETSVDNVVLGCFWDAKLGVSREYAEMCWTTSVQ